MRQRPPYRLPPDRQAKLRRVVLLEWLTIGLDVLHDGYRNVHRAMDDLMDHRPADVVTGEPLGLERAVKERLGRWPQIDQVSVRLREEGYLIAGEIFVVFRPGTDFDVTVERITVYALTLDWRRHDLVIMPVSSLTALTPETQESENVL